MSLDPATDMWDRVRKDWGARCRKQRTLTLAPGATKPGITQEQLGEMAKGVDQSTISRIEAGSLRLISDELKFRIASAMGCTIDQLFPWPVVMLAAA